MPGRTERTMMAANASAATRRLASCTSTGGTTARPAIRSPAIASIASSAPLRRRGDAVDVERVTAAVPVSIGHSLGAAPRAGRPSRVPVAGTREGGPYFFFVSADPLWAAVLPDLSLSTM